MGDKDIAVLHNIGAYEVQQYQQNRYPLFFVDEITEALPGKFAKGYKNFTYNEWFFPAHFTDEPNVPGFIQVEVLAQVFLMSFLTFPENKGKKTAFISVSHHFLKKIVPGMRLDVEATLNSYRRGLAKGASIGYINGEKACYSELVICVPDVMKAFRPRTQ